MDEDREIEDERNEGKNLFRGVRKRLVVFKVPGAPNRCKVTGCAVVCALLSEWKSNFKTSLNVLFDVTLLSLSGIDNWTTVGH